LNNPNIESQPDILPESSNTCAENSTSASRATGKPKAVRVKHQKTNQNCSVSLLLIHEQTGERIARVTFHRCGVMGFGLIKKGPHVFVVRTVERFFQNNGLEQPLYVKHAALLDGNGELPLEVVRQEAEYYARLLNEKEPALSIFGIPEPNPIRAKVVER
jgi:hypothetical protein